MKDEVVPEKIWAFNEDVTNAFDDMLERSIPEYELMRDLCFDIGTRFVIHGTDILDIGCSTGGALTRFVDKFGAYNRYTGIDVSEPMLQKARERFAGYTETGIVKILGLDLRSEFPPVKASLILSVLTIQFTPIEYRQKILHKIYESLLPGGAFIYVEKVLGTSSELDDLLVAQYYKMKADNGYTPEQIERKKHSLEGVLVPVTAKWNEELLEQSGFRSIDCFWRCLNFAGWIAVKTGV